MVCAGLDLCQGRLQRLELCLGHGVTAPDLRSTDACSTTCCKACKGLTGWPGQGSWVSWGSSHGGGSREPGREGCPPALGAVVAVMVGKRFMHRDLQLTRSFNDTRSLCSTRAVIDVVVALVWHPVQAMQVGHFCRIRSTACRRSKASDCTETRWHGPCAPTIAASHMAAFWTPTAR